MNDQTGLKPRCSESWRQFPALPFPPPTSRPVGNTKAQLCACSAQVKIPSEYLLDPNLPPITQPDQHFVSSQIHLLVSAISKTEQPPFSVPVAVRILSLPFFRSFTSFSSVLVRSEVPHLSSRDELGETLCPRPLSGGLCEINLARSGARVC